LWKSAVRKAEEVLFKAVKNTVNNSNLQSYQAQQARGRARKLELIRIKGMQCEECGYGKIMLP
jgi:hypothetical protein